MSRIGNAPIEIPQGVDVQIEKTKITVKGPKGELTQGFDSNAINIKVEDNLLTVARNSSKKTIKQNTVCTDHCSTIW